MQVSENIAEIEEQANLRAFTMTAALSLFSADCLKESETSRWILDQLYPEGPACPTCQKPFTDERRRGRWYELQRFQCPHCGRFGTAATGTILQNSPLAPRKVFLMAALLEMRVASRIIASVIGCSVETVRLWKLKFAALNPAKGDI